MRKILLIILSLICIKVSAQLTSYRLPVNNTMNLYNIRTIVQDSVGFIWLGSSNGLYRFDGYNYQRIQEPRLSGLLPDESIAKLENWGNRYLWIQVRGSRYACYDIETDRFVSWNGCTPNSLSYRRNVITGDRDLWLYDNQRGCRHVHHDGNGNFKNDDYTEENKALPSNHVHFIIQQSDGKAWIGTEKGLVQISHGKARVVVADKNFTCAQLSSDNSCYFITQQGTIFHSKDNRVIAEHSPQDFNYHVRNMAIERGMLIITTDGPTMGYDLKTRELLPHPRSHIEKAQIVTDNKGQKVVFDHDGQEVWYITPGKSIPIGTIYSQKLNQLHEGGRYRFVYGSQGKIWISTYGNGLFAYDIHTETLNHYLYQNIQQPLIVSDFLLNIFEDKMGQLWVCQESIVPIIIKDIGQESSKFLFTTTEDEGHANNIRLVERVNNHLILGNRTNDMLTTDMHFDIISRENPYQDDVVAITTDKNGRVWVGTRKRGIFVDGQQLGPIMSGKVSDILCDQKNRIWITMFDGNVEQVTTHDDGTMTIRSFFKDKHAIQQPRKMILDHRGNIWLCSNNGIYTFKPDELMKNDSAYQHFCVCGNSMSTDEVHCLYEDSRQQLWAGTTGYGLVCLNAQGEVTKRLTEVDGLPNDRIESITEDQQGNLWVGTGFGLVRYNDKEQTVRTYYLSNIELGNMYTEGCALCLDDGRLAFGTLHGLQVFMPQSLKPAQNLFPLRITNLFINGISVFQMGDNSPLETALSQLKEVRLSYDQNSLQFRFSDFEYLGTNLIKYSYLLEGYDKKWSELSTMNNAIYKNLPPGSYTLHIRAYDLSNKLNENEATLHITISQPWWNTWWAWFIYLCILAGIAWVVWGYLRQVEDFRTKIKVENELTEYKLRFFTNISHEFRTPLTIIRGSMDRISSEGDIPGRIKQPISSMQKSTDRMLRLINELLEFRKIQNHKLRLSLEEVNVIDFLRNIFLTFNETAENRQINYNFITFAHEYTMYIDRNYVDKMAYNLLSNAFKYTMRKRSVLMRVKLDEGQLVFEVEDTGIGIPPEKQANLFTRFNQSAVSRDSIGIGLHMVQELVRVHHGTISFRENPEGGSIFSIALPTDKSIYQPTDFLESNHELMLDQQQEKQAATISYKEISTPPLNENLRVLIVDDDDDMRDYIQSLLCHYFQTDTAYNGEEALEKIRQQRPDLLVSDVKMPVLNGIELVQRIRQDEALSDLPVILLTAIADEEKQIRGTKYGADDYLFKPFNPKILIAKCATLMEQRERMRIKYAKEVVGSAPLADIIVEDADKKFLDRFESWVYNNLKQSDIQAIDFANSMKMGRTTFFKKVKQVTGMPPHEYIRKIRFNRAAELLQDPTLTVSEVAYLTGFEDPSYFSRTFKEYFGITASQFRKGERPAANDETPSPTKSS